MFNLASLMVGSGDAAQQAKAAELFERSCELGDYPQACAALQ